MSEQENSSGGIIDRESPVVVVESVLSKRSVPFKPTELQDAELPVSHQKCAPAAAVEAGPEKFKESPSIPVNKEQKESEYEVKHERHMYVPKKLSSHILSNKRECTPAVEIAMAPIENESTKSEIITTLALPASSIVTPIPDIDTVTDTDTKNDILEEKSTLDSITSEIKELRSPETVNKWSDEEEAGGLSRSESRMSRASRVTRVVRELFCCGVQLEAPSEDNVSSPREGFFRSGI